MLALILRLEKGHGVDGYQNCYEEFCPLLRAVKLVVVVRIVRGLSAARDVAIAALIVLTVLPLYP